MKINKPYNNEVFDANKTFFTSDLHFGHKNIIRYCNRPHSSVDIMNERIVELWNRYIPEDADVFILGDVAFSMSKNKIREILNSMNGRKHLVLGNHDKLDELPLDCFVHISMQDQIVIKSEGEDGASYTTVVLTHYPLLRWSGCSRGVFSLHGHEHGAIKNKDYMLNQMDVGWDTSYAKNFDGYIAEMSAHPYSWQDICDAFTKRMMTNDGKPIEGF